MTHSSTAESSKSPVRPRVKARRVLFNCDGSGVRLHGNSGNDLNKWISNLFTGLEGGHVDALLWCDGSGGNTALYDSKVLELDGERIGRPDPQVVKWIKEGNDPPVVVIREARKRSIDVFYSFRINDIHDAQEPPESSVELPTFKVEHPEWLIGEQRYGDVVNFHTALDFAIPEVRELKFRVIEEIFQKYDFDGIEIDFMRGPPFFLPGKESESAPILTTFLRKVRKMLDARTKERGRRIEVAARVDETMEACRLDGFDVETWAKADLIDILIMGSGTIDVDVTGFSKAVAGTGVRIYPCLYGWPSKYLPIPAELARGIAATFWRNQPDGIYLFNWFPHEEQKHYQIDLLKEIGNPAVLASRNVMYAAERGAPGREYPHNWLLAKLPVHLKAGEARDIPIEVGMQPSKEAMVELRVAVEGDVTLQLSFDGKIISGQHRSSNGWAAVRLSNGQVTEGRHQIRLRLEEGESQVEAIEIHVTQP